MLKFVSPPDGAMLSASAGKVFGSSLITEITLNAPSGHSISVNGIDAREDSGLYSVKIRINDYETKITAIDRDIDECQSITLYWLEDAYKKYRVSVDDNIWFLQDIAKNADKYKSIFDNPYLSMYRDIHNEFGAIVHFNIYYECPENGGFNLTQMPDKFKSQWEKSSSWLRLSFHANANLPDYPYKTSSYDEVKSDCEKVQNEIRRFAGDSVLGSVTTLHYAEATKEGVRALHDCGIRILLGDFIVDENGDPCISYHATREERDAVSDYGFWKSKSEDMIYFASDIVLNAFTPAQIQEELTRYRSLHPKKDFLDLLIHEQYYYPDYVNYLPDYKQRIVAGIKWCSDRGYEPSFIENIVLNENFI